MPAKETAKQVMDSLPHNAMMDDVMHALYLNVKLLRGEKEIREGRRISCEKAHERLQGRLKSYGAKGRRRR